MVAIWCVSGSADVTEMVAMQNPDLVVIDCEHTAQNTMDAMVNQIRAVQAANNLTGQEVAPVVRLAHNDRTLIKLALDAGAYSILLPMVNTAEEAKSAVESMRYPPKGQRGVAGSQRSSLFGLAADYFSEVERQLALIVQIETQQAMDNLESIAGVDGVSCLFIGPNDLAASMGHLGNVEHPDVQEAIHKAMLRAKDCKMPIGVFCEGNVQAKGYLEAGFSWVAVGTDVDFCGHAIRRSLKYFC